MIIFAFHLLKRIGTWRSARNFFSAGIECVALEYRGGERRVGTAFLKHVQKIIECVCAAGGDHGNRNRGGHLRGKGAIETAASAVTVDRGEQYFACTSGHRFGGPSRGVEAGRVPATACVGFPGLGAGALDVDRENHGLRAELLGEFGNQVGTVDGGRVDGDFVGSGA
jgi:hypothetical protein